MLHTLVERLVFRHFCPSVQRPLAGATLHHTKLNFATVGQHTRSIPNGGDVNAAERDHSTYATHLLCLWHGWPILCHCWPFDGGSGIAAPSLIRSLLLSSVAHSPLHDIVALVGCFHPVAVRLVAALSKQQTNNNRVHFSTMVNNNQLSQQNRCFLGCCDTLPLGQPAFGTI